MALTITTIAANAAVDAITRLLDSGRLQIWSGQRPIGIAIEGQRTMLVEFVFSAPAFDLAEGGMAALSGELAAVAVEDGVASWFRCVSPAGEVICEGRAGTEQSADLVLTSGNIPKNADVRVNTLTIRQPRF